jgi:glycine hydroxymethyltransferase
MEEKEIVTIAGWFDEAIKNKDNEAKLAELRAEVKKLCKKFPLPTA